MTCIFVKQEYERLLPRPLHGHRAREGVSAVGRRELSGKGMLHPLAEVPRHLQKRGGVLHAAAGQGGREFRQGRERLSQRITLQRHF
jgi:hypothetical protein